MRYVLIAVAPHQTDVLPALRAVAADVRCEGTAAQCLLTAAEDLSGRDLHDVREVQLRALARRKGIEERKAATGWGG